MASASLAGFSMSGWNPQSFRPQLPLMPVTYPPCFGKGLTFRYLFQSILLAIAFLLLGIGFLVAFVAIFLPCWFQMHFNEFDSTFGSEGTRKVTENTGIMFYTFNNYVSLVHLEKSSNRQVAPGLFIIAQVMEVFSVCALGCSFGGAGILAFRKYSSVTGALFLAALGTVAGVGQILMVVFSFLCLVGSSNDVCEPTDSGCTYTDNMAWRNLPFYDQQRRINLHSTPMMTPDWALYVACIGAALAVAGSVLLWLEGLNVCKTVGRIRYQQLREKRDLHEGEVDPTSFIHAPQPRPQVDPMNYNVGYMGGRQTYRPPPSYTASSEASHPPVFVSRQVDL